MEARIFRLRSVVLRDFLQPRYSIWFVVLPQSPSPLFCEYCYVQWLSEPDLQPSHTGLHRRAQLSCPSCDGGQVQKLSYRLWFCTGGVMNSDILVLSNVTFLNFHEIVRSCGPGSLCKLSLQIHLCLHFVN